ncbi:MAG: DNA replication and repair protein RecF [Verrucomicrobia bacterium]|nr:DNA replication and repair protein RecF [Verrucomicrobiota bacterium]
MRLRKLTLHHFRNVSFAALEFNGRQQFLLGTNGQGKTNLLEAAGFLTALRSFRTSENRLLVSQTQHCAALSFELEHEREQAVHVTVKLRHDGKELWCDQERVTRLAEYLGRFPTVVFSSQDMGLVRGAPAARLAPAGVELMARRAAGLEELGRELARAYAAMAGGDEPASLTYEPSFGEASADALLARLEAGRARDLQFKTTLVGPQRDDFLFRVKHTPARDFASEGQQRSLVLALRIAQAAWCQARSGIRPVLLADDVLGELDPVRRARFWSALDPESQVIATGTHLPEADLGEWQVFTVTEGTFVAKAGA